MSNTKERPIVFSAQEVNAVRAGDKTQYRVIAKAEPTDNPDGYYYDGDDGEYAVFSRCISAGNISLINVDCPFGQIGDRLWVKEPFIPDPPADHDAWEDQDSVTNYFQWDGCGSKLSEIPKRLRKPEHVIYEASWDNPGSMMWFNALQMPRWASRLLLEITDIRIERVQDITHNDSVAEHCFNFGEKKKQCIPPLTGFAEHWREKHGNDAWRSNPWVWVIEFKEIKEVSNG